ncbi:MAG: penicillin-binding protein [Lawsonibacter sp.]|nr:penicillin-binding protein [Lawsonibacter sp.]
MDTKQFHRRVWAVVVLLCLMVTGMGTTLYDLQINQGKSLYEQTQHTISEQQTVEAARGQILDRNGRVLVSNKVIYQVTLDTKVMEGRRNQVLLQLIHAARDCGVEWADSLPITKTSPYRFTTDVPYFYMADQEDGSQVPTLTRLGRLAVRLGWLKDDPTQEPEPDQPVVPVKKKEPSLFDKLKAFLKGQSLPQEETPVEPGEPEDRTPPTAVELLGILYDYYGIQGEGAVDPDDVPEGSLLPTLNIGDMSFDDARDLAGVLYELSLRSQDVYWEPYVFAKEVSIDFISRVKELALPGVVVEATTLRQYHTTYAAHLLGRVAKMNAQEAEYYTSMDEDGDGVPDYEMDDTVGKEGVELAFESYLRGTPGTRSVERNTNGKIVSGTWIKEPEPGDNIILTLDIDLQAYVENAMAALIPNMPSGEAEKGAAVVLDVNDASVLAAASYPTFNLATYGEDIADNSADPLQPLLNRAFQGTYAPGSTFKMVTAIAGLEEEIIGPKTIIKDEGKYTFYEGPPQMCWIYRQYRGTHGNINVSEAIEVSCNYFFYEVGRLVGIDRLVDYATRFGLGQKTGLELTERAGVMAGPAYTESLGGKWYEGSTLSVAIGQESSQFTPIQLANYIATLVNGGTRNATHLLKEVKSNDFSQVLYTYQPRVLSTIDIKPENLEAVKAGMLALTQKGSVWQQFADLDFQVGGKTGSAQISATSNSEANAVFVCFAPYDDPQVAVAVVVEHGGSGSEVAGLAADILDYYFSSQETREEVLQENTLVR